MPSGAARGKDTQQPAVLVLNSITEHDLQSTEKLGVCEHSWKFHHVQKFALRCSSISFASFEILYCYGIQRN